MPEVDGIERPAHDAESGAASHSRICPSPISTNFVEVSAVKPHRAARVQLLRRDADLGAKPELPAVGEAGRRVHVDRGRVHLGQEAACGGVVARDDRLGVLRAVAC